MRYTLQYKMRTRKEVDSSLTAVINLLIIIICGLIVILGMYRFYLSHSFKVLLIHILSALTAIPFMLGFVDRFLNEEKIMIAVKNDKVYLIINKFEKIFNVDTCYLEIFDDGRDRSITIKENDFSFSRYVSYPFKKEIFVIAERIKNKSILPKQL